MQDRPVGGMRSWQKFIALMDQMYACNWMQATILTLPYLGFVQPTSE